MNTLALNYGTDIDWGNTGFLEIYALSFGVSTVLTIILWLFAVAKRAAQGVHFGQALSESIGYLLMSFMASAFAPAAIAYVVKLLDGAAEAMLNSQRGKLLVLASLIIAGLFELAGTGIGAPIACFLGFALLMILLGIWLLLVIRNGLVMTGMVFGPTVFSGLVNKDLWKHTRHWAGKMVAIIAAKYLILTVFSLAVALTAGILPDIGNFNFAQALVTVITVVALLLIALFAPFEISKLIPILGDELQMVMKARGDFVNQAKSAYDKGMSSIQGGGLQGGDNPRLGGGGGGGAGGGGGGGGAEGAAATVAAPEVAAASAVKDHADDTKAQYEDAAVKGLGGGQDSSGGDSAGGGGDSPASPGSGGAPAPSTPSPPPPSSSSGPGPQPAPTPPPSDGPASDNEGEA